MAADLHPGIRRNLSRHRDELVELAGQAKLFALILDGHAGGAIENPDVRATIGGVANRLRRTSGDIAARLGDVERHLGECNALTHVRYGTVDLYKPCRRPSDHPGDHDVRPAYGLSVVACDRARRLSEHADLLTAALDELATKATTRNPELDWSLGTRHRLSAATTHLDNLTAELGQVRCFVSQVERQLKATEQMLGLSEHQPSGPELVR